MCGAGEFGRRDGVLAWCPPTRRSPSMQPAPPKATATATATAAHLPNDFHTSLNSINTSPEEAPPPLEAAVEGCGAPAAADVDASAPLLPCCFCCNNPCCCCCCCCCRGDVLQSGGRRRRRPDCCRRHCRCAGGSCATAADAAAPWSARCAGPGSRIASGTTVIEGAEAASVEPSTPALPQDQLSTEMLLGGGKRALQAAPSGRRDFRPLGRTETQCKRLWQIGFDEEWLLERTVLCSG